MDSKTKHPGMNPVNDTMLTRESWKIFQIMSEFVEGFERLARICPSVSIFGSARTEPSEPIYQKCVEFSRRLAELGYMVITGGGGGIMQAGNEGAGAENSFAVNIRLPFEQDTNPVMENSKNVITYKYFFNRKVAFLKEAQAVALFPGGFGTLDEAMETLTLVQTGKNPPIPLVLIDDDNGDYWEHWFQRRHFLIAEELFRSCRCQATKNRPANPSCHGQSSGAGRCRCQCLDRA